MKDAGLYAITVLIWGASWIGILWQVGAGVESAHALFYRYIGATLIIFGVLSLRRRALGAPLRIHALFFAQGATMFGANYLLLYIAVEMGLTTGLAAVIYSLLIIMNAFNTAIFFREAPGRAALIAAPIGIAGVALLFWTEIAALAGAGAGGAPPVALFLTVGAVYFASLGNMVSRRLQAEGVGVAVANGWAMGYGALSIGAWILVQGGPLTMSYAPGFLISLAFLTVFSTVIAFWAYLTLLGRIGADRAAYAFVAFPVVALGLSSVFEGFEWTPERLAGVALVLAGNVALLLGRRSGAGR